ncbi:hypothetical protein B0T18DRAFT_247537 [Schizothecium vesticola]|uniref:Uncharacterized protein n=1 Tax=Schizothecium vesticola TaxID=314040 RepID=A0AA40BQM8_9PEZI|nr:hypothetical protein B0T18DRAFT_247537 [Schizothecium vesticola]
MGGREGVWAWWRTGWGWTGVWYPAGIVLTTEWYLRGAGGGRWGVSSWAGVIWFGQFAVSIPRWFACEGGLDLPLSLCEIVGWCGNTCR